MPHNAKKILIFSTSYLPSIGGAELAVRHITDQLPGYAFDLITARTSPSLATEERMGNVRVFRVGSPAMLFNFLVPKVLFPLLAFRAARALTKRAGGYDIVFASQASQAGGAAYMYKKFFPRVKLLCNLQEGQKLEQQNIIKRFFRKKIIQNSDIIVTISNYLKDVAIANGAPPASMRIIPNGVDDNFFSVVDVRESDELKQKLGIATNKRVIISASRLVHKNGLDTLIRALPLCTTPAIKLILVGDGKDREKLNALARQLGVQENILFVGSVPHDTLPSYLHIADVFARLSRSEGLGSAFLEAMASRVPIVGTPVGGIKDFLKDRETGMECPPNDPVSTARAIDALLQDAILKNHIVAQAYHVVEKKYRWDLIAQQYDHIFSTITQ